PFAFLDDYESDYVCNHTDVDGRYSFKNQPGIAHWNLAKLAKALSPILNYEKSIEALDEVFGETYEREYLKIMFAKMGINGKENDDVDLLKWMLGSLQSATIDFTLFFRTLSLYNGDRTKILALCTLQTPLNEWLDTYDKRLEKENFSVGEKEAKMLRANPKYILKNHILQEAIEKAQDNDFTMVNDLLKVAHAPFDEHKELEHLTKLAPEKLKNIKLSCSS
ncbi:MAG: SELO family protein, partial [Epsilonproteobacteria bacterium]